MSNLAFLDELEQGLNRGSMPLFILGLPMQKGMVGRQGGYRFVVNSDDHMPPHVHIALNNNQIAKYDLLTGRRIESSLPRLDKIFAEWYAIEGNRMRAKVEWERFHGTVMGE